MESSPRYWLGWVFAALTLFWLIFGVGIVASAYAGSVADFGCPVPGADSEVGIPRWQWNPPGHYCVRATSSPPGTPRVWNRPSDWTYAVLVVFVVWGYALVVLWRRFNVSLRRQHSTT